MRRKRARSNARNLFLFVGKVWSNYKKHQTRAAKYVKKNYKIFKVKNIRRSL